MVSLSASRFAVLRMFINILTFTSTFIIIFIVASVNCEGDRLWDVRVDPMLQVYDGERWKHICFYGERMATAHVACRQQGYTNATSLIQFLMRSDQIVTCPTVSNYFLYGETNIMHCNMTYFGNPFYVFCNALKIICNNDTIKETNPYNGQIHLHKQTETDSPADGVVEVYLDKHWYRVCSNNFTKTVADSICRQYGYTGHESWTTVELDYLVDSVIVTEYICTQQTGSFQCFSHCISSNYSIGSCQSHVAVTCSFDIYAKYLTSGSRSQCALDEDSHGALDNCSHCAGDESGCSHFESLLQTYRTITGALIPLFLFSVLVLLIIAFWFGCKKKCCHCYKKYDDLDYVKYKVDHGLRNA